MGKVTKKRRLLLLLPAVLLLSACGDDLNAVVPVKGLAELAEPIVDSGMAEEEEIKEPISEADSEPVGAAAQAAGTQESDTDDTAEDISDDEVITITISAAGDVSLGNHQNQDYYYSFRQAYDQAEDEGYFFENVLDILGADDFTIMNLEGVLTLSENMAEGLTYNIKGDPEYVDILTAGSVEGVSMGNNHRLDYGEGGSRDTVAALEQAGIVYAYDNITGIYETKGIRIGFVSVNEAYWGAKVEKTMQEGIKALQEEGADLILACCHWGTELEYYPEDYQTILGEKCIDWGADLVIGHHPHVLQGVDIYKGKYIIYSLGNFCFGANRNPSDKDTMIFQQTFTFRNGTLEEDGEVRVIPCYVSSVSARNDFKPTLAEGEEARRIIDRINEYSSGFGVAFDEDGALIKSTK